jgi:alpha-beta hydrolase superfamily lysophospholipase
MTQISATSTSKRRRRWPRRLVALGILLALAILAINFCAYMQARAMMRFVATPERTPPPESLSLGGKIVVLFTGVRIPRPQNGATPANVQLEYQTVRFGGESGNDCEAWYIPCHDSKGICLLFHAYVCSKSSLLVPARAFHDMGYDVLMVDFRGSGGSVGNDTTIGYREAEDVVAAVAFANRQWPAEPMVLYGQSMGGAAILRAVAELGVNPAAVIVESTFDRLLTTVRRRFEAMGIPAFPAAQLLVFWGSWQIGTNAFNFNPADYAAHVHCPTLIMQDGLDQRVSDAEARNLFDHLAGPKELEISPDSGHCGFLADHPARWKELVSAFVQTWTRSDGIKALATTGPH